MEAWKAENTSGWFVDLTINDLLKFAKFNQGHHPTLGNQLTIIIIFIFDLISFINYFSN